MRDGDARRERLSRSDNSLIPLEKDDEVIYYLRRSGGCFRRFVIPPYPACASLRANLDRLGADFYEEE